MRLMKNSVPWQATAITCGLLLAGPLYQAALGITILILIFQLGRSRSLRFSGAETIILLYVASGFYAFWFSGADGPVMGRVMLHHLALLAWIPLARAVDSLGPRRLQALEAWVRAAVLLGSLVGLVALFRFLTTDQERASGMYGGFYFLSGQMVWVLPLGLSLVMTTGPRLRAAAALGTALAFAALCFSYTRSAFLGWFLASGLWLLTLVREGFRLAPDQRPRILRRLGLVTIPLVMLVLFLLNTSDDRVASMLPGTRGGGTPSAGPVDQSSGRRAIINDGLSILRSLPAEGRYHEILLGTGLDSRKRLVGGPFTSWESDYLQVLLNQGVVGLGLLLLIWGRVLVGAWRGFVSGRPEGVALAVGVVGLFLMSPLTLVITGWQMVGLLILGESWLRVFREPETERQDNGEKSRRAPVS